MKKAVIILCLSTYLLMVSCVFAEVKKITFCSVNQKDSRVYKISNAVLTEGFKRLGFYFELLPYPAKRAPIEVNAGRIDGDSHRIIDFNKENKFPNLIRVEESIQTVEQSVFTKLAHIKVDGWKSLAPYKMIYMPGVKVSEAGMKKARIPVKNRIPAYNIDDAFKFLRSGRGDIIVVAPSTGNVIMKKLGISHNEIKLLEPPVVRIRLYPYMHKKDSKLAKKLAVLMREMKQDGTYNMLLQRIFSK